MKKYLLKNILIIAITHFFISCSSEHNLKNDIDELRDDFKNMVEEERSREESWENYKANIYKTAENDVTKALTDADNMANAFIFLNVHKKSELYFIQGDILMQIDSFYAAIDEFNKSIDVNRIDNPATLSKRAGCYLQLQEFEKAYEDLHKAYLSGDAYAWHLANYFEAINEFDSAIYYYNVLYQTDSLFYKKCAERIDVIESNPEKNLNEIIYIKQKDPVKLVMQSVEPGTAGTAIGKIIIEKINYK